MQAKRPIALLLATLAMTTPLAAQNQARLVCAERSEILQTLEGHYGESVRSVGLAPHNRIVEVFASEDTGTWTTTVTSVDGTTCLMASGQHYEVFAPALPGEPL